MTEYTTATTAGGLLVGCTRLEKPYYTYFNPENIYCATLTGKPPTILEIVMWLKDHICHASPQHIDVDQLFYAGDLYQSPSKIVLIGFGFETIFHYIEHHLDTPGFDPQSIFCDICDLSHKRLTEDQICHKYPFLYHTTVKDLCPSD